MRAKLSERNAAIVARYLEGKTLEQVGQEYGITRERVRQILIQQGVSEVQKAAVRYLRRFRDWTCRGCGKHEKRDPRNYKRLHCSKLCARKSQGPTHSEDDLIADLRRLAAELGRTPGQRDINASGKYWHMSYVYRFGSIRNAQERAGLTPRQVGGAGHAKKCP